MQAIPVVAAIHGLTTAPLRMMLTKIAEVGESGEPQKIHIYPRYFLLPEIWMYRRVIVLMFSPVRYIRSLSCCIFNDVVAFNRSGH